jgi:hypothetical protein
MAHGRKFRLGMSQGGMLIGPVTMQGLAVLVVAVMVMVAVLLLEVATVLLLCGRWVPMGQEPSKSHQPAVVTSIQALRAAQAVTSMQAPECGRSVGLQRATACSTPSHSIQQVLGVAQGAYR